MCNETANSADNPLKNNAHALTLLDMPRHWTHSARLFWCGHSADTEHGREAERRHREGAASACERSQDYLRRRREGVRRPGHGGGGTGLHPQLSHEARTRTPLYDWCLPDWKTGAARAEAAELKKLIDRGGDPLGDIRAGRDAPTMADLCDRFLAEYLPRKRPSTQKSYRQQIEVEIRPASGRLKVADVASRKLMACIVASASGRHTEPTGWLRYSSRMFSMAVRWSWRLDNPSKGSNETKSTSGAAISRQTSWPG